MFDDSLLEYGVVAIYYKVIYQLSKPIKSRNSSLNDGPRKKLKNISDNANSKFVKTETHNTSKNYEN